MRAHRLGVAFCVILAAGPVSGAGQRAISAGVYSAAQAARGEAFYRAKCGDCHGKAMDGAIGPPLVGEGFLANWSARPLAELVDKIQKTMPFEQPGSLSRQESTDLVAYLLRAGRFPGGSAPVSHAGI